MMKLELQPYGQGLKTMNIDAHNSMANVVELFKAQCVLDDR